MDNWYPVNYSSGSNNLKFAAYPNYGWVTWNCDWLPGGMGVDSTSALNQVGLDNVIKALFTSTVKRFPTGWYELASWQGMAIHGNLLQYPHPEILGELYLQRKYWDDTDIRLRGGTGDGTGRIISHTGDGDMLKLLDHLTLSSPFDLLFRIDAP